MIAGMYEGWYEPGDTVQVTGSTGNDGNYTIDTAIEAGGITVITVIEAIPSATADGYIGNVLINQLAATTKKGYYKDKEMPTGFYYYVVYSVDDKENYSDPSNIIQKFAPTDITPPATPTGLVAVRSSKYNSVELNWNELEQYDLKGYIIRRSLNPYAGTPTWETITITSSNKFTDSDIPRAADTSTQSTDVSYYIEAYDQDGNVSSPTSATAILNIPLIQGIRVSLDYLNLNIYWDEIVPEVTTNSVACLMRLKGSSTWTFMGVSEYPKNFFRMATELVPNTDYELALAVVKSEVHPIIEAVGISDRVFIAGDYETEFPAADLIAIYDSSNQDGQYEIDSSNYSAPSTRIDTVETLPSEYTVNGVELARNFIQVSGDHVADFEDKLVYIYIFGSTGNDGRYRVLSADLYLGSTRLILQEILANATIDGEVTSGTIVNLTDLLDTIQTPVQLIPIPDYDTDTTEPVAPLALTAVDDPENRRVFLNWAKIADEDDFYGFHIEINVLGGDFPILEANTGSDYFRVDGDQTAYIVIGQRIYIYGTAGGVNDGWYDVVNVTLASGDTRVWIDGAIPSSSVSGKLMTDYAWDMLDKTKNTSLQAYFPFIYDYTDPMTYWFRVIAVDRSGNKSQRDLCITSLLWANPFQDPANLSLPQWMDYTEYQYSTYNEIVANTMRRYQMTINDGARNSKWFKRYVLYFIQRIATGTPQSYFTFTGDEIIAFVDRNLFTWETLQDNITPETIYIWPAVEDVNGLIWPGPISSIMTITPTVTLP